ncbi:MAG TPA: FkbM family methyltransferase [Pyrinomonadaceae bacterium]|nr:FkbM family methyltransferase [Pyrinomonadaceae bacterium]
MGPTLKSLLRSCLPHAIQPQRILAGPLRGHWIVTSWHDYPAAITGRTESSLLRWFAENVKLGETWLDVGAHYGYTAIALCRLVGPSGRVFAVEPMVSTAGYMTQMRHLNRFSQLVVLPLALGDVNRLEISQLPATRGMVDSTITEQAQGETILVAQADWLWSRICGRSEHIHGVKIDVQGMELSVLRGMWGLIRKFRPQLVVELHQGVDRKEFLDLIESLGYSRTGIPVEPAADEIEPRYFNDHSYAFRPG